MYYNFHSSSAVPILFTRHVSIFSREIVTQSLRHSLNTDICIFVAGSDLTLVLKTVCNFFLLSHLSSPTTHSQFLYALSTQVTFLTFRRPSSFSSTICHHHAYITSFGSLWRNNILLLISNCCHSGFSCLLKFKGCLRMLSSVMHETIVNIVSWQCVKRQNITYQSEKVIFFLRNKNIVRVYVILNKNI